MHFSATQKGEIKRGYLLEAASINLLAYRGPCGTQRQSAMAAANTAGQISTSIVQITAHLGAMAWLSEQARVLAQEDRVVVGRATNEMGHIAVLVSESTLV